MPTTGSFGRYGQMGDGQAPLVEQFSVQADLAGGPNAAARARRMVEGELVGRLPRTVVDDVMLLVTELVANGVRHGGAGVDSSLHLLLEGSRPGRLHVEVVNTDHGRGGAPVQRAADLGGGGGIGLNLVERLSSRWGVRDRAETAVWFEFDC